MAGCHRAGRTIGGDRARQLPGCCGAWRNGRLLARFTALGDSALLLAAAATQPNSRLRRWRPACASGRWCQSCYSGTGSTSES